MQSQVTDSPLTSPDAVADRELVAREEVQVYIASHWKLMWWRFRRHKLALISGTVVLLIYAIALFCEFLAPSDPNVFNAQYKYAPPQRLHILDISDGSALGLYVYGYKSEVDPVALFVKGHSYKLFGLIPTKIHLGVAILDWEKRGRQTTIIS